MKNNIEPVKSYHYNYAFSIKRLSHAGQTNASADFIVIRKHETHFDPVSLIIPVKKIDFDHSENGPSLSHNLHVRAKYDPIPDDMGFSVGGTKVSYVVLDFANASCLNESLLLESGMRFTDVGKILPEEFAHIQVMVNALWNKPDELRPFAWNEFLAIAKPDNVALKPNSVWTVIVRNRLTPSKTVAEALENDEESRRKIQDAMDRYQISITEAKELLEKELVVGLPTPAEYHERYRQMVAAIPEKLFMHGRETVTEELENKKQILLDYLLEKGKIPQDMYIILKRAGYTHLNAAIEQFQNGNIWLKLEIFSETDVKKMGLTLRALASSQFGPFSLDDKNEATSKNSLTLYELYSEKTISRETLYILRKHGYNTIPDIISDCDNGTIWEKCSFDSIWSFERTLNDLGSIYALQEKGEFPMPTVMPFGINDNEIGMPEITDAPPVESLIQPEILSEIKSDVTVTEEATTNAISEILDAEPPSLETVQYFDMSIPNAISHGVITTHDYIDVPALLSQPVSPDAPLTLRGIYELTKNDPVGLRGMFYGVGPKISERLAEYISLIVKSWDSNLSEDISLQDALEKGWFRAEEDEFTDYEAFLLSPKDEMGQSGLRSLYNMVSADPTSLSGRFEAVGPGISKRLAAKIIRVYEKNSLSPAPFC